MKKTILYLFILTLSASVLFTACKKDSAASSNTDSTTQTTTETDDQSRVSNETDAVADDANTSLEASTSISGRVDSVQGLICDATVVTDTIARTITITYNGTNCFNNRTRTGVVVITLPSGEHWKTAGATVSIAFQNLKITRLIDNKSIIINGTHTYTNVSGGLLKNLSAQQSITHTLTSSNMSVTFDDGSVRTWQVARQRQFSYSNGIVVSETGLHTDGNKTGIEEWGTTRFGNAFTNAIVTPLVVRQDCSFRLVSGSFSHVTALATTTVTFGLDATGAITTCPVGYYYFKAVWTGAGGKVITVILPY